MVSPTLRRRSGAGVVASMGAILNGSLGWNARGPAESCLLTQAAHTLAAVRPNVLCVVLDTARADALEPYGADAGATPAIAQLASKGTAAPRMYAAASWTLPSHASMFTGLLPRATGIGLTEASPADAHSQMQALSDR